MMTRRLLITVLGALLCACASTGKVLAPQLDGCRGYLSRGEYADAQRFCGEAFAVLEQATSAQQMNARQLTELASSAIRFGDYRIAEQAAGLAVAHDGDALAVLALAKLNLGDEAAAIARGSEYLGRYGIEAPMAIDAVSTVGMAAAALERFDEARRMVKLAHAIAAEKSDGYATVSALALESSVLRLEGDRKGAGELAARALERAIQSGLDSSTLLNKVAKQKFDEARYNEARALLEQSLAVAHLKLWNGHPDYARAMHDLGLVDYKTGRTDDAETRFLVALKVRKARLGPTHSLVAQTLNNLAVLYQHLGDLDQAAALYEKALDISLTTLGRDHRRTQLIFANLERLAEGRRKRTLPAGEAMIDGP